MIWLLIVFAVLGVAAFLVRARYWPYGRCPRCKGRRGRGVWSSPDAYNRCGRCAGSGERIRPLARIWPRHREEARRRKEAVKRQREAER